MSVLIFIDTNIWLDFYRIRGDAAARHLKSLERHKDVLITGDQVWMEFLKNRQKEVANSIADFAAAGPKSMPLPAVLQGYKPAEMLAKAQRDWQRHSKKIQKKLQKVLRNPGYNDPVYKCLSRIMRYSGPCNLTRDMDDRYEIRELARKRFELGYPPRKSGDKSIGDAINWEWLIHCAKNVPDKPNVLIVSRDGDFGLQGKDDVGEMILNDWLQKEFRERVSSRRKIELTNRLTTALKRMDEQVTEEDVEEESRLMETDAIEDSGLPAIARQLQLARNSALTPELLDTIRMVGSRAEEFKKGARIAAAGFNKLKPNR